MTVLVFKANQLGDNVVFLPVVQRLAAKHPGWRMVVVTSPLAAPLYRVTCPGVEVMEVATAELNGAWRRPWVLLKLMARMRGVHADACLVANDQGNVAHLLARASGARLCAGPLVAGRRLGGLLHERAPLREEDAAAEQNWRIAQALLRRLGEGPLPERPPAPDLTEFGREEHGAIVIHAGASREYQRWPLERYAELANQLCAKHPVVWMVQGAAEEETLDARVRQVKPATLAGLIRMLAGARLFVGNNSGPMHLAAALGVPGVILTGPSAFNWDPYWHRERFDLLREPLLPCQPCDKLERPANVCLNAEHLHACLDRWSVAQVRERVMKRLATAEEISP